MGGWLMMSADEIVRALLRRRRVTVELVNAESADTLASKSLDPGEEIVRLSDIYAVVASPNVIVLNGNELIGWHTLTVPMNCEEGELFTPVDGWKHFRHSSLFDPRTRRVRLNHPSNPILRGWLHRALPSRFVFCF